ncbi:MAG TPA: ABATE domain-containing protein [Thermomicrobiales bacterium]|nr:ABATE domain-containing protein [Thermomicrobiales bacterium]
MSSSGVDRSRQFELRGGEACLDFVNTVAWRSTDHPVDYLESVDDLLAWGSQAGVAGSERAGRVASLTEPESRDLLRRARALRESIHGVVLAATEGVTPSDDDLARLDHAVRAARAHERLARVEDHRYGWEWAEGSAVERVLWSVAASAADLLTTARIDQVKVCAAPGCGWMFVDASRNHSRRWCDTRDCGNRERVRKYLATKRANRHPG